VQLGSKVVIQEEGGIPESYILVGAAEADPFEGRISNESPLGQAMLGKKVGDRIQINAPAGKIALSTYSSDRLGTWLPK
jgi:transcription elongation factor GreA